MPDPDTEMREGGEGALGGLPDPLIRGGGGGGFPKKLFRPFGPQFGLTIWRGGRAGTLPWIRPGVTKNPSLDSLPFHVALSYFKYP